MLSTLEAVVTATHAMQVSNSIEYIPGLRGPVVRSLAAGATGTKFKSLLVHIYRFVSQAFTMFTFGVVGSLGSSHLGFNSRAASFEILS